MLKVFLPGGAVVDFRQGLLYRHWNLQRAAWSSNVPPEDTGSRSPQGGAGRKGGQRKPAGKHAPVSGADSFLLALHALATHFGKPLDIANLRTLAPSSKHGRTAKGFARAARRLGFRTREAATAPDRVRPPFLLLGAGGKAKALVLEREGDRVRLIDLASGESRLETLARLGGVQNLLFLRPRLAFSKTNDLRPFRLFGGRFRRIAFEILLASLVINVFALAAPIFVMTVYNKVIAQAAFDTLNVLVLGMVTLYAFDAVLRGIRGYIVSHTGARVDAILGGETMRRVLNLPYRDLEKAPAGLMGERFRQLDTIREFFTSAVPVLLVDQLFVLFFLIVLFVLSPLLGGIALAALPVFALLSFTLHQTQRGFFEERFQALAQRSNAYMEALRNALTVKALGLEGEIKRRWEDRVADAAATGFRAGRLAATVSASGALLQQLTALAILFFGARLVIHGELSIGALVAANLLAVRAIVPIRHAVSAWNQLQETRTAFQQLRSFFESPQAGAPGEVAALPPFKGRVRLEDLTFSYDPGQTPALEGLNLEIPEDTIFAIVGPAGSGKSTLAKLLQGLYTPSSGRVLIDDMDIAHLSAAALRRQVVAVPQESQLFSGTVRENLLYGLHDVSPERAVAAAKFVGAHAFIEQLPQGYDTVLGESERGLSAGQKQMLCVGRAIARNPKVLLLDEATNAIDPAAEEALLQKLRQTAKGHTVLLLTNRLAPATIADRIAFLVDGRIEREGPRSEMLDIVRRRLAELAKGSAS